ncbi:MAG: ATP-binding protein [Selenomonadaceae bacterium]|nr:ATP-binding protein [Selenomonadaceae bacterium]
METLWKRYEAVPENYDIIRDDIIETAKKVGVSTAKLTKLELGFEEIVVNVISYAYDTENRPILIKGYLVGDKFRIEVVDYGRQYNPLDAPQIPYPPKINQPPGGYGVFLVKQFFESVTYEYEEIEGILANHLTMELTAK